jgi:hypothetical protein
MNFVSAFELSMGSLSTGLIIFLGPETSSNHSGFRDLHYIIEGQACYLMVAT